MRRICAILLCLTVMMLSLESAESVYNSRTITPERIKTLRVRYIDAASGEAIGGDPVRPFLVIGNTGNINSTGTFNSQAVIDERGDLQEHVLEISFDEMSHEVHQYTYSVLHLNADGTESRLSSSEYLSGFTTQDITDYEHSLNTSELYTHYRFTFPNENMRISASGNYAVRIYEDGDTDKTIAMVHFAVVEPLAIIKAKVRPNTDIELNGRYQQLDIDVDFGGELRNTRSEDYFIVVRQNGRDDNIIYSPKATFVESQRLRFTNCKALIFEGGNEYRHFDTYSTYFAGTGVDRIIHDRSDYHAILFADDLRGQGAIFAGEHVADKCGTPYIHEFDVNGQRIVNAERTIYDIDTEAEYMWVHWTLSAEKPWFDGVVYVGGDVFENNIGPQNRMQYDSERKCYWLNALVKQGGADYQYWFLPKGSEQASLLRTEGSHWQTGNEYAIYVYYRPFGSRYDQLVGLQILQ